MCYSHFMRSPFYLILLAISILLLVGSVAFLFTLWPKEISRPLLTKSSSPAVTASADDAPYEGTIFLPDSQDSTAPGSYRLLDPRGQTVAFLQSGKIDLRILQPGLKVLVTGRREQILENNIPLITVDKLNFR